jgi:hypothetical protein
LNLKQRPNPILKYEFLKNFFFLQNKNMTGYLIQDDDHPNWKFSKIQILSSCEHFVEHWQKKIQPNRITVRITVLARSCAVSMLLDGASIVSSVPSPDPSQEKRRGNELRTQGPLPATFCPARYRPAWRRQRRPTAPRGQADTFLARTRGRRACYALRAQPGPPQRRASGRPCPRLSGL